MFRSNPHARVLIGLLAELPSVSGIDEGTTFQATDGAKPTFMLTVDPITHVRTWTPVGGGGGGGSGPPLAMTYFDAGGNVTGVLDFMGGALDPQQRPGIHDFRTGPTGRGAASRLGAWGADGDFFNVASEGFVTYGPNAIGVGPDGANGGMGFYEPNGFGVLNIIPGSFGGNTFYLCGFEDGGPFAPFGLDGFIVNDNLNVPIAQIRRSDGTSTFREVDLYVPGGGVTGSRWRNGSGTPEGALIGSVGDLYTRLDGGAGTTLYVKETGTATNTGWVAVAAGSSVPVLSGAGDPEGVVTAPPGTIYMNTLGGLNQTMFLKVSGVGNVNWDRIVMVDRNTPGQIGQVFIGQNGKDHNSNAGIQYTSDVSNRAAVRVNQYGAFAPGVGVPGFVAFKSGGPIGGPDVGVVAGDVIWRGTAVGLTGTLQTPNVGYISIQVPAGGANPTWVSTEYELQLVPLEGTTNSIRPVFKITSQGVPVLRETPSGTGIPLADPAAGVAILGAAGTFVVANRNVKAGTRFTLTWQARGTVPPPGNPFPTGVLYPTTVTPGTGFTITSSAGAADEGQPVYWQLWEGI